MANTDNIYLVKTKTDMRLANNCPCYSLITQHTVPLCVPTLSLRSYPLSIDWAPLIEADG